MLISDDYYPAVAQPNVEVVTEPVFEVTPSGIVTDDGVKHEVDTIIYGTGFRVTDLPVMDMLHGRDGKTLREAWADGMEAHLGTAIAGFPNFFLLIGPNTGLGHSSMVFMIESQIAYILDALRTMDAEGLREVEVRPEVQREFVDGVRSSMRNTVWTRGGCTSWYLDAEGRNTTLWPSFTFRFRQLTRRFDRSAVLDPLNLEGPLGDRLVAAGLAGFLEAQAQVEALRTVGVRVVGHGHDLAAAPADLLGDLLDRELPRTPSPAPRRRCFSRLRPERMSLRLPSPSQSMFRKAIRNPTGWSPVEDQARPRHTGPQGRLRQGLHHRFDQVLLVGADLDREGGLEVARGDLGQAEGGRHAGHDKRPAASRYVTLGVLHSIGR